MLSMVDCQGNEMKTLVLRISYFILILYGVYSVKLPVSFFSLA